MNIRGQIPWNFVESAEVVPLAKTTEWIVTILHRNYHLVFSFQVRIFVKKNVIAFRILVAMNTKRKHIKSIHFRNYWAGIKII